MADVF